MQMKLVSSTMSLRVPKVDLGVNLFTGTYIQFMVGGATHTYGMAKGPSAGRTGGQVLGHIDTNWFGVTYEGQPGALLNMNGQLAELEVSGLVPAFGAIDIRFTLFDRNNSPGTSLTRVSEPARGFMLADMKIRSTIKKISG